MKKIFSFTSLSFLVLVLLVSLFSFSNVSAVGSSSLVTTMSNSGFSFTMDLELGDTDPQVLQLQKVLNSDPDTTISATGVGSPGQESSYFGNLTKTAVIKFQNKYRDTVLTPAGVTTGNGYVGLYTRTKLNQIIGVANTRPSVGQPQSHASSASNSSGSGNSSLNQTSTCRFVEVLISIQAIPSSKATQARSIFNCSAAGTIAGSIVANNNTNLIPSVDVKINDRNGTLSINSPRQVTVSWTSANVTSCTAPGIAKPLSGSQRVYVNASETFAISCSGPYGQVYDSVSVRLTNTDSSDDDSVDDLSISCTANPAAVNLNSLVTWVTTVSGGGNNKNYSWSGTDDLSSSNNTVSKAYSTAGAKAASVTVTSGSLTASAACNAMVTDYSTPSNTLNVSCSAIPSTIAVGEDTTWAASPSGGTGEYTYSWSGQGVSGGDEQNFSQSYSTTGTKTARVTVTSGSLSQTANCSLYVGQTNELANASSSDGWTSQGNSAAGGAASSWTPSSAGTASTTASSTSPFDLLSGMLNPLSGGAGGMNPITALSIAATIRGMSGGSSGSSNPFIFSGRVASVGTCDTNQARRDLYNMNFTPMQFFTITPCGGNNVGSATRVGYLEGQGVAVGQLIIGTYSPGGQVCADDTTGGGVVPVPNSYIGRMITREFAQGTCAPGATTTASGAPGTMATGTAGTTASGTAGTVASSSPGTTASGWSNSGATTSPSLSYSLNGNNNANNNTGIDGRPLDSGGTNTWSATSGLNNQGFGAGNDWNSYSAVDEDQPLSEPEPTAPAAAASPEIIGYYDNGAYLYSDGSTSGAIGGAYHSTVAQPGNYGIIY